MAQSLIEHTAVEQLWHGIKISIVLRVNDYIMRSDKWSAVSMVDHLQTAGPPKYVRILHNNNN
jgi:hypothetical protein